MAVSLITSAPQLTWCESPLSAGGQGGGGLEPPTKF